MNKKFTEKDLGKYVHNFYLQYKSNPKNTFEFDFSEYEWISNQNLLVLSSLIKYLYRSHAKFKIKLFKTNLNNINKNEAKTILQLWEIWKIHKIFDRPDDPFGNYILGFTNNSISYIQEMHNLNSDNNIYNRLGITPFVTFDRIVDYKDEDLIETEINPVFTLNDAISTELSLENSEHPFVEDTLSTIITRELYENFLDHYQSSFFDTDYDMSFMSISLKRKLGRGIYFLSQAFLKKFIGDLPNIYQNIKNLLIPEIDSTESAYIQIYSDFIQDLINEEATSKKDKNRLIEKLELEDFENKQYIIGNNIEDEELPETDGFFKDLDGNYTNEAYIQYSFIDYGRGIPTTILNEFLKDNKIEAVDIFNQPDHNDILKFAFKHYTSRFPIYDKYGKTDKIIPRGLFDILTIAQRYQGLLIVRSNYGKLIFNFKKTQDFDQAVKYFGRPDEFFPGTYITMYIPEISSERKFDKSVIRYEPVIRKKKGKPKNINLFTLLGSEFVAKENLYVNLITKLNDELTNNTEFSRVNYISFFGIKDRRIITKAIYYLLTDYEINSNNVVVIMHPPKKNDGTVDFLVSELKNQIIALNKTIKNFKIHPLPLIYYNSLKDNVWVEWLGVYDEDDKTKLDNLLFEQYSLALTDFNEPENIKGNLITADSHGNVEGRIPNRSTLCQYYQRYTQNLVEEAIDNNKALKSNGLYLCSGNYYQDQFLQMSELLDNRAYRDVLATSLFEKIYNTPQN